jgi:hypothetical protein
MVGTAMRIESLLVIALWMATIATSAFAQNAEDLNVWNVYCSGDGSRCTVAKEPSGDLMFPVYPSKVDWNTVQNWMASLRENNSPKFGMFTATGIARQKRRGDCLLESGSCI